MKALEFKINVDTTAVDELIEKLNRVNELTIKKDIHDMTNEEILRQQLELLAELSLRADFDELPRLSTAMVAITGALNYPSYLGEVESACRRC